MTESYQRELQVWLKATRLFGRVVGDTANNDRCVQCYRKKRPRQYPVGCYTWSVLGRPVHVCESCVYRYCRQNDCDLHCDGVAVRLEGTYLYAQRPV